MFPKSNVKLKAGDYCLIPRADGTSVAFAYLGPVPGLRSAFYGALLSPAFDSQSELPAKLNIAHKGMVRVSSYAQNNTPILGNIAHRIGRGTIDAAFAACTDMSVGAVHRVIGHIALLKVAESISA